MENNSFGTSDIIDYRGLGLGGYGNYNRGNSFLAAEAHANGTAVKEAIDCNSTRVSDGMSRLSDQAEEGRRQAQVTSLTDGMVNAEFRTSDRFSGLAKDISDVEFRSLDRQRDIERILNQNAKDAAKCCCEAQLQQCKDTAALSALIIKENSETRALMNSTALDAANAKIIQLETINALRPHPHP